MQPRDSRDTAGHTIPPGWLHGGVLASTYYNRTYSSEFGYLLYSVGQKNWHFRFSPTFISKKYSHEVKIISVDSLY